MKKISMFLIVCFVVVSTGVFAQLKVSSTGKVGIGADPDASYNLNVSGVIFKGYQSNDIIMNGDPSASQVKALYPSVANTGRVGVSTKQFLAVYAQTHYANLVALTSDKRLKENFRTIDQPLTKILQMTGMKYDFISQGTDTIKNEIEKERQLRFEKDRLGFIAQDLEQILPEAVFYYKDEDRYYVD